MTSIAALAGLLLLAAPDAKPEGPKPIEINQGGYVEKIDPRGDSKGRLPRILAREPADSLKALHILPGFRIDQVAAEPLVCSVVDMTFDENGRMYVVEMIPYAEKNSAAFGSPDGRVVLLEDLDGDGRFDKSTVFADKFVWPTAVGCFDGGVFIASAPDVWYCKDTDGDGKADVRELVFTGFELSNPNALPNSFRWGLDNRIHLMGSTAGGKIQAVRWQKGAAGRKAEAVQIRGRDMSFHPRTGEMRLESGGGQYGMTFDPWGAKFESTNTAPIEMVMYEDRYLARNPYLDAPASRTAIGTCGMTSCGGVTVYTGDAWPEAFRGNAFVCEGAGNLVHRMRLEPDGVGFKAYRTEEKREFLTSDETWFRPIQFCNAPDGALYLADMYREVFEHPDAVPPSAKKYLDLTAGKDRGRIYRFVPDGFQPLPPARLGKAKTEDLVGLLAHPNGWHRETAGRLLYERQDVKAVPLLVRFSAESASPLGRMHALYGLDGLAGLTAEVLLPRLDDPHPRVREHAVRLSERVLADAPALREKLYAMTGDPDLRVRYQLAFTLGEIPGPLATAALARLAARDGGDRWVRTAVLSSSLGRAGEIFARLAALPPWRKGREAQAVLEQVARQVGLQGKADQAAEVLKALEDFGPEEQSLSQAAVRGLNQGLARSGSPLRRQVAAGGTRAGDLLSEMIRQAKMVARDGRQPPAARAEAVRSLALAPLPDVRQVLAEMLESRQPRDVQLAALAALGRFADLQVSALILDAWPGISPQVRGAAAETLFSRRPWLLDLLSAVEADKVLPTQIEPNRVQWLLVHPDAELRARATRLLGSAKPGPRKDVVAAYRDVLSRKGDAAHGKAVFQRDCATCHKLEDVGFETGRSLTRVQAKGREWILTNLLDPNLQVLPQYMNYTVLTKDGTTVTGMIDAETATSISLRRTEGVTETVLRANIEQLQSTGQSLMPEGLERQVNRPDMAGLLEYLMTVK